jgi:hypothetical protein
MDIYADGDLTESQYWALSRISSAEELTTQFAVVYLQNGERVAVGPYPRWVAEEKARELRGVVAERTREVAYGVWTATDERFSEFDKRADSLTEEG